MPRTALLLAATLAPAILSLLLGLTGTSLRTGRLDPLDWLWPGAAGIILGAILLTRAARAGQGDRAEAAPARLRWPTVAALWAVVSLPPLCLIGLASVRLPWAGMIALAAGLAIVGSLWALVAGRSRRVRLGSALALCAGAVLVVTWAVPAIRKASQSATAGDRPSVALFSALPLHDVALGAAHGLPAAQSIGLRSPLLRALDLHVALHPLDALNNQSLAGHEAVLLAQPRAMAPEELVALDRWVRAGGRAVVLADPLLLWPDPRPLVHPGRPPLTSLLDPLLAHWGVRLEAAEFGAQSNSDNHRHGGEASDRRSLASGALLQVAGASRFVVREPTAGCTPAEQGFIATCRLGRGQALLVADADWIDDRLWTLASQDGADRALRTSDAPDVLAAWLRNEPVSAGTFTSWVKDEAALVRGLRFALAAALVLSLLLALVVRNPRFSQLMFRTKTGHNENIRKTEDISP
ncbi:hypothetical protein M2337_001334 [Sphingobium sp. B2D3A]|uniref:GldG family protein n=1 Tax=unclassified Sphingobium TaxID=2611147 RepID=UPI0022244A7F|nr:MULTISPECIES: GldG family protein [unclassified Sphingobium]MCW2337101.1 hypothetical protein [Sphingobium sp. B2D3A]MCW2386854.1 hypothetical protein [Sphingobium sp. B2D3D]